MIEIKRVYVAGPYSSAPDLLGCLDNIRDGMRAATELLLRGYAPFVPFFDFHFQLMLQGEERLSFADYRSYSLQWLRVAQAVLALPGSRTSEGARAELAEARERGIPVCQSIEDLEALAHPEPPCLSPPDGENQSL